MPKDTKTLCIKKGCASVLTQPLVDYLFQTTILFILLFTLFRCLMLQSYYG